MHQQPRATEHPLALKIVSRSDQRSGVRGAIVSIQVKPRPAPQAHVWIDQFGFTRSKPPGGKLKLWARVE